jgi:membrane fusion protein, multidrug efflux system
MKRIDRHPALLFRGNKPALCALVLASSILLAACKRGDTLEGAPGRSLGSGRPVAGLPVPIVPGMVERKDVPIFLEGLGTVQAFNSVAVRSRVDGQIDRIAFTEGQEVHAGDLLAEIDPRPFQAQLDQATAKKAQDEAQLAVAKLTLARDKELLSSKILAQQDYDVQLATVDQLEATVQADQAAIDNAKTQLSYTMIRSPLDGRIGIRLVDQGNIVHANDANALLVINQVRPISVLFTLPEESLPEIQVQVAAGQQLATFALGRENRAVLGEGTLAVVDNQIDTSTGMIRLKATFPNKQLKLWPGQFVNVRLLLEVHRGGAVVPASVIQRGPDGPFAYVISNDVAVVRSVKVSQITDGQALVQEGLEPGEKVVVDGQYKLQAGARVQLPGAEASGAPGQARKPAAAKKRA